MAQLQIIDNKKKNYRKKSVISLCNVDYRLERSGPKVEEEEFSALPNQPNGAINDPKRGKSTKIGELPTSFQKSKLFPPSLLHKNHQIP